MRAQVCPQPWLTAALSCVLAGLAKAEDKSRMHRAKKPEGPGPEDVRKKVLAPASTVSKEAPAPAAHTAPGGGPAARRGPGQTSALGRILDHRDWGLSVDRGSCAWHPGRPGAPTSP